MMAAITRTSLITGKVTTREIRGVTQGEVDDWVINREARPLIQSAFPSLSEDDREFIRTGITPEEWAAEVGQPGDDE